jgi:hypothetical protein
MSLRDSVVRGVQLTTVAPGYPISQEVVAPFVPDDNMIRDGWGEALWNGELNEYMSINAFSKKGMERVAQMNDLELDDNFFPQQEDDEDNLQQCFVNLALRVHKKGTFKNIHLNFIEGMHRQMAWTHAIYGAKFHPDGLIIPNTLQVQDFKDAEFQVGEHDFGNNDKGFRNRIRKRFFEPENDHFLKVPLSVYYVNQKKVNGTLLSNMFVYMSKLHSESKRDSNTRCPWQTLGVEAEKYVNSFYNENIVYRPNFQSAKFRYPKIPPQHEEILEDTVGSLGYDNSDKSAHASSIIDQLYPHMNPILNSSEFKNYARNPYSGEAKEALIDYMTTGVMMKGVMTKYNGVGPHTKYDEIKDKKVGYPFYPSYASMAEDVGTGFDTDARMNPMMANNLIHFPLVLTILWEAIKNLSRHDTLKSEARLQTIEYYLRFHNNPDECSTNLDLHGVYAQVYCLSQAKDLHSSGAEIMGAAHIICQMWNVFVAVQTETSLNNTQKERTLAFQKAGAILKRTFTNIGSTVKSANNMDVAVILGKCPKS